MNDDDEIVEVRAVKTEPAQSVGGIILLTASFAFVLGLIIYVVKVAGG